MEKTIKNIHIKRFGYYNLYVIKGNDGDILIDTGFFGIKQNIKKWLDQFNIKLVILTHAHIDHTWNAAYIKKRYNCQIAISKNDIKNLDNSTINSKPSKKKYTAWTNLMNFGMKKFKTKKFDIDISLNDNQIINKYGLSLSIIPLPGHTSGSIGVYYDKYLFAGDALVNRFRHPQIAYQNQDNREAKKTYNKIIKLNPQIIFLGHDKEINIKQLEKEKENLCN